MAANCFADLKAFVHYVMGSPYLIDAIAVVFDSYENAGAVSVSTCSRQVPLSINIKDKDKLITVMKAVIDTMSFITPYLTG